jgi:predicted regulator of Ras-like GTPase activity (Roadblock/LC7/MglB family)
MADKKISELTALASADVVSTDVLPIVDISATTTKKITVANLAASVAASGLNAGEGIRTEIHGILIPSAGATGHTIAFEGATDNDFETVLTVTDPTADRTITFPNATGTVALTSDSQDDQFLLASAIFTS